MRRIAGNVPIVVHRLASYRRRADASIANPPVPMRNPHRTSLNSPGHGRRAPMTRARVPHDRAGPSLTSSPPSTFRALFRLPSKIEPQFSAIHARIAIGDAVEPKSSRQRITLLHVLGVEYIGAKEGDGQRLAANIRPFGPQIH